MLMRLRPRRGEKYNLLSGEEVTIVESLESGVVKCLSASGKLTVVQKNELDLPVVNTVDYEKIK